MTEMNEMIKIPTMLTIKETAKRTGLAEGFIRKLVLNHEIVFVRTGKKYLVNFEKFADYLNQENEAVQKGGAD